METGAVVDTVIVGGAARSVTDVPAAAFSNCVTKVSVPDRAFDLLIGRLQQRSGILNTTGRLPLADVAAQWSTLGKDPAFANVPDWNSMTAAVYDRYCSWAMRLERQSTAIDTNTSWSAFLERMHAKWLTISGLVQKVVFHPVTSIVLLGATGLLLRRYLRTASWLPRHPYFSAVGEEVAKHMVPWYLGVPLGIAGDLLAGLRGRLPIVGSLVLHSVTSLMPTSLAVATHLAYNALALNSPSVEVNPSICQESASTACLPKLSPAPILSGTADLLKTFTAAPLPVPMWASDFLIRLHAIGVACTTCLPQLRTVLLNQCLDLCSWCLTDGWSSLTGLFQLLIDRWPSVKQRFLISC
jgi:hypothetical protein